MGCGGEGERGRYRLYRVPNQEPRAWESQDGDDTHDEYGYGQQGALFWYDSGSSRADIHYTRLLIFASVRQFTISNSVLG